MSYVKREFTAQIIDDFKTHWIGAVAKDDNSTIEEAIDAYDGDELNALHDRISGQRVTLMEYEYPFGGKDYFEKVDNNFVIYRELFAEVAQTPN
ncbi:MAG: hypothetical protein GY774_17560 [Planctomycetes bacterium]|nr:hypothetical protein [Planctomycetota bacterium]